MPENPQLSTDPCQETFMAGQHKINCVRLGHPVPRSAPKHDGWCKGSVTTVTEAEYGRSRIRVEHIETVEWEPGWDAIERITGQLTREKP